MQRLKMRRRMYISRTEISNVRLQDQVINQLIDEGIDGIAVAVTQSKYLVENSLKKSQSRNSNCYL